MIEILSYPPDSYCEIFLSMYEQLNGPEAMEPVIERRGRGYDARIWCSRGEVLEKAGLTLLHIRHDDPDGRRLIRHFDTVIHPHNPRVPGFVIVVGHEVTPSSGRQRIYCLIDLWQTTRRVDEKLVSQFRQAIQAVCQDHDRSYAELHKALPAIRLFGGNGCSAGLLFSEFDEADIPFLDHLVHSVAREIPRIIQACGSCHPDVQDFQERNEIRREFLVWALTENQGNRRAVAAGVPWAIFEAFAFPPEVHY